MIVEEKSTLTHIGKELVWNEPLAKDSVLIIEFPAPGRSRFWVDSMHPNEVLAWSIPNGSLDGLAMVFGAEWAEKVHSVVAGESPDTDDNLRPPSLDNKWTHLVMILALQQWSPATFKEVVTSVDEALAV